MNTKVKRIRDLSYIKESQKKERRENAIRHQEMLKSFLDTEKATRKDDRPLQYVDERDISAFGPNTSMLGDSTVRGGGSRSVSRSPIRLAKTNSATFTSIKRSTSRTRPISRVLHTA